MLSSVFTSFSLEENEVSGFLETTQRLHDLTVRERAARQANATSFAISIRRSVAFSQTCRALICFWLCESR
jgi:hypothetical protein